MKNNEKLEQLRLCMSWFESNFLPTDRDRRIGIRADGDIPNYLQVRVRANTQEELMAIDTAVKFYAAEIDKDWRIDFC